jgi:AcrR family transcriptional regulator
MTPRRAVPEELSRQKIMQAARELFVSQGYRAVSMRGIAKKLGYSHGAIYYHFQNKAELFSAMVVEDFQYLSGLLRDMLNGGAENSLKMLEQVFLAYIRFGLEHKPHYEIMFTLEESELKPSARDAKMKSYEEFASVIVKAMQEMGKPQQEQVMVPWMLFMSLHGFVSFYLHSPQTYDDVSKLAEGYAAFLVKGLQ